MRVTTSWIHQLVKVAAWLPLLFALLIAIVFLGQFVGIPSPWACLIALLGWSILLRFAPLKRASYTTLLVCVFATVGYLAQRPSHDRNWMPEIAQLPQFEIQENILKAKNLRDFAWSSSHTFQERWTKDSYDLNQIKGVDLIVVPFGDSELAAHVMLSFGFENGRHLAVSVETRPEVGEKYSLIGGAARQLELIYLFGSERDLLGLRILHRGNRVYCFPLKVDANFAKELLLELCSAANQLRDKPRFYATLRHNCTTTLLRHVNRIREDPIGIHREILFPAQLGKLLYRLGYLNTELDWPETQKRDRVDETIRNAPDLTDFSQTLRANSI